MSQHFMNILKLSYFVMLILPLVFISCHKDPDYAPGVFKDGVITYNLRLNVSGNAVTYAMSDVNESSISTIDVVAFTEIDGLKQFAYRVSGSDITRNGNEISFKAKIPAVDQPFRLVVIANARKELDALGTISKGALKADLLARIISTLGEGEYWNVNSAGDFTPIPMWGESDLINYTSSTLEITLLRALARIDVELASSALENFLITSVSLYNSKTSGIVTSLALPSPLVNNSVLTYNLPPGGGVSLTGTIYTFEAAAQPVTSIDATALVIGGKYNGSSTISYYRLDFLTNAGTPLALLRNNKYIARITEVNSPGSVDKETAWNNVFARKNTSSSTMGIQTGPLIQSTTLIQPSHP